MAKRKTEHDDGSPPIIKLIINKGSGKVLIAARHNLRERQAEMGAEENINPLRTHLNVVLAGPLTAQGVSDRASELMAQAGIGKLRNDAGRSVECVISLPADTAINTAEYFNGSFGYVQTHRRFAGLPVLSAAVHYDEGSPHMHVLLLPLVETTNKAGVTKMTMRGSDVHGNTPNKRDALQADFYDKVGKWYGLCCPATPERLTVAARGKSADLLMGALQGSPEIMDMPGAAKVMWQMFYRNPVPMLTVLGLSVPTTRKASKKSFVEIMTKPCSLEKPIGFTVRAKHADSSENIKPIGFTVSDSDGYGERVEQNHSCGWFADSDAHKAATASHSLTATDDGQHTLAASEAGGAPVPQAKARDDLPHPCAPTPATDATTLPDCAESTATTTETPADSNAPTTASESPDVPATHYGQGRGRKAKVVDVALALKMRESGTHMDLIADYFDCKKSTLYAAMPHPEKTLAQKKQPQLFG